MATKIAVIPISTSKMEYTVEKRIIFEQRLLGKNTILPAKNYINNRTLITIYF